MEYIIKRTDTITNEVLEERHDNLKEAQARYYDIVDRYRLANIKNIKVDLVECVVTERIMYTSEV